MRFVKGHGTENDFVILPDPDGKLDLDSDLVAALCDRRAGIGADGVLRVVRALPDGPAEWFMDYRNADGSVAEMCGNGLRVFARYLVDAGLAGPGELPILTRAGVKVVRLSGSGPVTVDMGAPVVLGRGRATVDGRDYEGLRVSMGNPHLACLIEEPVSGLDLSRPPVFDPSMFPDGVNVELFGRTEPDRLEMRVYERGSGETRSCGTGAVATAVAAARSAGRATGTWEVDVLGGTVEVILDEETSYLRGPAVLVAEGEWLES